MPCRFVRICDSFYVELGISLVYRYACHFVSVSRFALNWVCFACVCLVVLLWICVLFCFELGVFRLCTWCFCFGFVLRVAACVYTVAAHDFLRKPVLETLHKQRNSIRVNSNEFFFRISAVCYGQGLCFGCLRHKFVLCGLLRYCCFFQLVSRVEYSKLGQFRRMSPYGTTTQAKFLSVLAWIRLG
jgi:hypothetical protein